LIEALLGIVFLALMSTVVVQSLLNCRAQAQLTAARFESDSLDADRFFNSLLRQTWEENER
jgi:hypothetical protein